MIIGFLGVLFVGLKLAHVIEWSWLWVTAPFWGLFLFYFLASVLGVLVIKK